MSPSYEDLIDWCLINGLVIRKANPPESSQFRFDSRHAPFSISPYIFPYHSFRDAIELSTIFNELIQTISMDYDWICETLYLVLKCIIIYLYSVI